MKDLFAYAFLTLLAINLAFFFGTPRATQVEQFQYSDTSFTWTSDGCFATGNGMQDVFVTILVMDIPEKDVTGDWNPRDYIMRLEETDIDTIAHEVHHAVDTIYEDKNMTDDHMKAYMQGNLTECVVNFLEWY